MALDHSALLSLLDALRSSENGDLVRSVAERLLQELIEAEATARIGAGPHERTETRSAQRNGHRPKTLTTAAGDLDLRIPKLRAGSFFHSLLERRRRIDRALFAVVMEAYLHGVSTRAVDDLVVAMGANTGISKSEVSRICKNLDEEVASFRDRPLSHIAFPYSTWTRPTVRPASITASSPRPWSSPPASAPTGAGKSSGSRSARARTRRFGPSFYAACASAGWQRCHVHFARNLLAKVHKGHGEMVAALFRTVFAQTTPREVATQLEAIAGMLEPQFPAAAGLLREAGPDCRKGRRQIGLMPTPRAS
jgi:putative transposase